MCVYCVKKEAKVVCLRQKADIKYPCSWSYKIIANKKETIETVVKTVCKGKEYELKHSNSSKKGSYISMNMKTLVTSEDERTAIFDAIKTHEDIKMVL